MAVNIRFTFCSKVPQDSPGNTEEDLERFRSSIGSDLKECSKDDGTTLQAALGSLPQSDNCVFYFTGFGSCDDQGHVYIQLNQRHVYIKDIIKWFPGTIKKCQMFFEICLPPSQDTKPTLVLLPSHRNFLVAISGFNKKSDCRSNLDGGKWTKRLSTAYSTEKDKRSMAAILTMVASEKKPLFTSSGQALCPKTQSVNPSPGPSPGPPSNHPPDSHLGSSPGSHPGPSPGSLPGPSPGSLPGPSPGSLPGPSPGSLPGPSSGSHLHPSPGILDSSPTKEQLKKVLKHLHDANNDVMWKDRFANRLLDKLGKKCRQLTMITRLNFFIDFLYKEQYIPTWRIVIDALDSPSKIKADNEIVSDEVKRFLGLQ